MSRSLRDSSRPQSDFNAKRAMILYDERIGFCSEKLAAGCVDSRHVLEVK